MALDVMANDTPEVSHTVLPGGIAGTHPDASPDEYAVGPSTSDQLNTLRFTPVPIACWSLFDSRFEFDSSFVKPGAKLEFAHLTKLLAKHTGAPLSVFGHADTTGDDDYNKHLSGRRAKSIYGVLTRDVEGWQDLFNIAFGGDSWGTKTEQQMLAALGFYTGEPTGALDQPTAQAIRSFRGDGGSTLDTGARAKLIRQYMDYLCGPDLSLVPNDFLARGLDTDSKHGPRGDVQGCADFNPLVIFSKADSDRFKLKENKVERDDWNAPNRRVLIFLYPPGSFVDFKRWPCPRSTVGAEDCKKRFWSDYKIRRSNQANERTAPDDGNTFACRFYDRTSNHSICERIVKLATLRLRLIDDLDKPFASFSYSLEVMGQAYEGVTNTDGLLEEDIPDDAAAGTLTLFAPPQAGTDTPAASDDSKPNVLWTLPLTIANLTPASDIAGAQNRLNNLGFFSGPNATGNLDEQTKRALQRFQTLYKLTPADPSGTLDDDTVKKLTDIYGS
jgi:peptidoglycan hydrolase-like protein with peptidoglycan-binding domain